MADVNVIGVANPKQQDYVDLFISKWQGVPVDIEGKGNHRITITNPVTGESKQYTYTQFDSLLMDLDDEDAMSEEWLTENTWAIPAEQIPGDAPTFIEEVAEAAEAAETFEEFMDVVVAASPEAQTAAKEEAQALQAQELPDLGVKVGSGNDTLTKLRKELQTATMELAAAVEREHEGQYGQNASRLIKGRTLARLEELAKSLKNLGADEVKGLTPLQFARAYVAERMEDAGIFDTRLDDSEVNVTRKVYRALEPFGGVDARFNDVYAWNPNTEGPLVRDNGEPFNRSVTEIAMNKLWYVSSFLHHDPDRVLSFANRMSEKALKQFKRLKPEKMGGAQLLSDIAHVAGGTFEDEDGRVKPWGEKQVREWVNQQLGTEEVEKEEFRNITVPKGFYDSEYRDARMMSAFIMGFLGMNEMIDEKTGLMKNVFLLGPILRTYFSVEEFGPWRLLEMFTNSGTITTAQAAYFRDAWEEAGLAAQWAAQRADMPDLPDFEQVYEAGEEEGFNPERDEFPEDQELPF